MSYQSRRPTNARVMRAATLGDLVDDGMNAFFDLFSEDEECASDPGVKALVAQRQAQIDDLSNNWNPTGFYKPDQLGQAIAFTMRLTETTQAAIAEALRDLQLPRHVDALNRAHDELSRSIGVGGLGVDPIAPYSAAVERARAQGADAIEATGFKRTVLNVMRAVRDSSKTVAVVACARPWFVGMMQSISAAFGKLYELLKAIGNLVVDAAKRIAKIPDTIGTLFTVLKWSVLLGGSYFIGVKTGLVPEKYDPLKLGK